MYVVTDDECQCDICDSCWSRLMLWRLWIIFVELWNTMK